MSLKNVTFGENSQLTTIDIGAFADCTGLTSIAIPDGVINIDQSAFYGCKNLTNITISGRATLPSLHPQNNYSTL